MCEKVNSADLERIAFESEMALRRLERMIEFLRLVCQKEAKLTSEKNMKIVPPVDD
jgi:hypothetical protein